ncbi:MAG: CTP synthase [Clostridiales Family XIII bacterium]|jgi:CTP synthase|nr:CTP synthase [Clostridiales Family XIII bacterium]
MTKYIFVTGGVVSGLGKGITAASLGRLLKARSLKVSAQKLDPYINVDPGTMSPIQHGEVFVTEDGAETDLDLGHYERFIDVDLNRFSNLTTGKVYWNVLQKERRGEYLGETVQVIPHVTNEIKQFIYAAGRTSASDIVITEIGGTIGDIESQPFLEAIRQVALEIGKENCLYIHVTLVPFIEGSKEYKSKPTQHSVRELQSMGISPDIVVLRSDGAVGDGIRKKIALYCNIQPECVIENITLPLLYEAPLKLEEQNFSSIVCKKLRIHAPDPNLEDWLAMLKRIASRGKSVRIALVGKYTKLHDAYFSIAQALAHAGYENEAKVEIVWIESEDISEENVNAALYDCGGILIPGGFGDRGIEGKIIAAGHARRNNIPYLGICLGMQVAAIEFARNVLGLKAANSTEFDADTPEPVIYLMADQHGNIPKGGTMRLGAYPCDVAPGSALRMAYGQSTISERHRHRYEFNNQYRDAFSDAGMSICGLSPDKLLVEAIELKTNNFFVGVQFHPEFKSRPNRAHPLFKAFISAALGRPSTREVSTE